MSEITQLVNTYCQHFKDKEQLRKRTLELNKEVKESHEKLKEEMSRSDLRIIRSISCGYDIKLYSKLKKPGSSIKNLRKVLEKHSTPPETIDSIMEEIKTGKEETSTIIKLIPLSKSKADTPVVA